MSEKSIPERSNLSIVMETCLREFHRDKRPGEVLPYEELSRKTGADPRPGTRRG